MSKTSPFLFILNIATMKESEKIELINEFLEKVDLKEHELVYWKHKASAGFQLKKFMKDFLDYIKANS